MSSYKQLFIWVEGNDDERFFKKIIIPKIRKRYDSVKIIKYRKNIKKEKISNFIKSINAMNAEYIFFADINSSPCATAKKEEIKQKYKNVNKNKIIIVIKEIESWYLAGLDNEASEELKTHKVKKTDDITKEKFNTLIPKKFTSRIDFMSELLKKFSIKVAKRKNKSFEYFVEKYGICNDDVQ